MFFGFVIGWSSTWSHFCTRQIDVSSILFFLFGWWQWAVRYPETCKGGTNGKPLKPTSLPNHTHPQRKIIGGGRSGGGVGGRFPLN